MAERIQPPPAELDVVGDERREKLDHLLALVEEKGLIDLLTALTEGGMDGLAVLLKRVDTPGGRATITRIAELTTLVGAADESLILGARAAIDAASDSLSVRKAPTLLQLFRRLLSPEARIGLGVAIGALEGLGRTQNRRR